MMKIKFSLQSSSYDLQVRGNYILFHSKPRTTTYGLNSFSSCQLSCGRNVLPGFIRTTEFTGLKENPWPHLVQRLVFLIKISLNIMHLVMYLYMLCILAVNLISRRYKLL